MRLLAACAALPCLASLAARADVAPGTFRLEPVPFTPGDRATAALRWRSELTYRIEQAGTVVQEYAEVEGARRDTTLEILAADEGGPTALRVSFAVATVVESDGAGGARDEGLSIAGRTFEARRVAGAWNVVEGGERAVSSTVAASVLRAAEFEGARWQPADLAVARELAGRDLSTGAPIALSEECARALVGRDSEVLSIAGVLVAREPRDVEGSSMRPFDCTFEIVLESADARALDARATLAGELVLDARTGRLRSMELAGETRVAAAASGESALEITAEGPWTVSRRAGSLGPR